MSRRFVVVTGASRGLGLAVSRLLVANGFNVVAASRHGSPDLDALIGKNPEAICFKRLDLAAHETLHGFSAALVADHGIPYGLVNNAAIAHDGVLGTMHESEIEDVIAVNVTGTIILTKYISRAMLRRRNGRIVNVSSVIASTGFKGLSVYAASKAALIGFTRSLARELGRANITVNAVAPGYMRTAMTSPLGAEQLLQISRRSALRRLTSPDEAANAVLYLLSDDAAAITGTVLTVDAGSTA